MTVTCCDDVPVAPSSSVTVRLTLYVPPAAYVCVVVDPEPLVPSPKFHAHAVTVPSASLDDRPSKATSRPFAVAVNAASGMLFGGGGGGGGGGALAVPAVMVSMRLTTGPLVVVLDW